VAVGCLLDLSDGEERAGATVSPASTSWTAWPSNWGMLLAPMGVSIREHGALPEVADQRSENRRV